MYRCGTSSEEELYGVIADHFIKHLAPFAAVRAVTPIASA